MRVIQRLDDRQYVFLGTCRDFLPAKRPGQEIAVRLPDLEQGGGERRRRFARFRCTDIRTAEGEVETVVLYNPAGPGFALLPGWRIAGQVRIESFGREVAPVVVLGDPRRRPARIMAIMRAPQRALALGHD